MWRWAMHGSPYTPLFTIQLLTTPPLPARKTMRTYHHQQQQQAQEQPSSTTTTVDPMEESTIMGALGASLAGNKEWVSNGILVQVHELIDPCSEATEVDIASTIGLLQLGSRISFDKTGVSNF
jgi:hypothetical protein